MRFLLLFVSFLLFMTGCTMHPPSTAAFMDATEKGRKEWSAVKSVTIRPEYSQYENKDDGWDFPLALETLSSEDGYTKGFGLLPSPYFTIGYGTRHYGFRGWISAPWLIGTIGVLCPVCLTDDDEDDDDEDDDERYDVDNLEDLGDLPSLWLTTFAGGASFIQQFPIGSHLRLGIEEFVARNVWIPVRNNNEQSGVETGITFYINFTARRWHLAAEARYSILDMNPDRTRLALSISFSYDTMKEHSL